MDAPATGWSRSAIPTFPLSWGPPVVPQSSQILTSATRISSSKDPCHSHGNLS